MIHLDNTIKKVISDSKYRTQYFTTCDTCGISRGYLSKQNAIRYPNCKKCSHSNVSEETRLKMSQSFKGRPAWNKGLKGVSEETSLKMRIKKIGVSPANKGKECSREQRIQISCTNRNIEIEHFDDFTTDESSRERNKFADLNLHNQCFERHNYACDRCGLKKVVLQAHHKNGWKHFPEQRFSISNLVSLCSYCHKRFHNEFGNGKTEPNTEQQYIEFKQTFIPTQKKTVLLVAGVSGAGKSWVCERLADKVYYHSYDQNPKNDIRSLLWNTESNIILYDPFSHVSTFINKNSDIFDIKLYVIQESEATIRDRLEKRGGKFTKSIKRRIDRMKTLSKRAVFSGTSEEVLKELSIKIDLVVLN